MGAVATFVSGYGKPEWSDAPQAASIAVLCYVLQKIQLDGEVYDIPQGDEVVITCEHKNFVVLFSIMRIWRKKRQRRNSLYLVSGDLAKRKLLPALDQIFAVDEFNDVTIVGVSRRDISLPETVSKKVRSRTSLFRMNMAESADYVVG